MDRREAAQHEVTTIHTRNNHAHVISLALDKQISIDRNIVSLLISVIVIVVLLLSGKSWGG
jgi:hypothetical protein